VRRGEAVRTHALTRARAQYIRVNVPTPFVTVLDDMSEATMDEFDRLGNEMLAEFGDKIMAALKPRLDELQAGTAWDRRDNELGRLDDDGLAVA